MKRILVLLLLVPFTACTPGRVAIAAGAGVMAVGGMAAATGTVANGVFAPIEPGIGDGVVDSGIVMLVGGALLIALGIAWDASDHKKDVDTTAAPQFGEAPRYAPARPVFRQAPSQDPDLTGMTPESTEPQLSFVPVLDAPQPTGLATPADRIVRERMDYRLSLQASTAAQRGQCAAAIASSTRLAQIAPAMQAHLVRTDAAVARCLAQAAPR